jgi:hypothetical protein
MTEPKPQWRHSTPEEFARWLYANPIKKITHHWRMTGADTDEAWIEVHPEKGFGRRAALALRHGEIEFSPDHRSLVRLRQDVEDTVRKIIAWEELHEIKLAEYQRLKAELGL